MSNRFSLQLLEYLYRTLHVISMDRDLRLQLRSIGFGQSHLIWGRALYERGLNLLLSEHRMLGSQVSVPGSVIAARACVEQELLLLKQALLRYCADEQSLQAALHLDSASDAELLPNLPHLLGSNTPISFTRRRMLSQNLLFQQMRLVYAALMREPALVAEMADYGYPRLRLEAERAQLEAVLLQDAIRQEVQAAYLSHKEALKGIVAWLQELEQQLKLIAIAPEQFKRQHLPAYMRDTVEMALQSKHSQSRSLLHGLEMPV
jgi:hypothetical protein